MLAPWRTLNGKNLATAQCTRGAERKIRRLADLREEFLCVIFLDLHKAHDALDRSRCLEILEG